MITYVTCDDALPRNIASKAGYGRKAGAAFMEICPRPDADFQR
ncbi:hypothetical protein O5165_26045 [Escherichia coli]|nr:hypothetical protein [Escherichia coli]